MAMSDIPWREIISGAALALSVGGSYLAIKVDIAQVQTSQISQASQITDLKSAIAEVKQSVDKIEDRFIDRGFTVGQGAPTWQNR